MYPEQKTYTRWNFVVSHHRYTRVPPMCFDGSLTLETFQNVTDETDTAIEIEALLWAGVIPIFGISLNKIKGLEFDWEQDVIDDEKFIRTHVNITYESNRSEQSNEAIVKTLSRIYGDNWKEVLGIKQELKDEF